MHYCTLHHTATALIDSLSNNEENGRTTAFCSIHMMLSTRNPVIMLNGDCTTNTIGRRVFQCTYYSVLYVIPILFWTENTIFL